MTITKSIIMISICLLALISKVNAKQVEMLSVSKDKTLLALAFEDYVVRLYSLETGKLVRQLESLKLGEDEEQESIEMLSFTQNDSKLVGITYESNAITWDLKTNKPTKSKTDVDIITLVAGDTTPNGSNIKANEFWKASDNTVTIIDNSTKKEKAIIQFKDLDIDDVEQITFSQDGKHAALTAELNSDEVIVIILDTSTYAIKNLIKPMSKIAKDTQFISNNLVLLNSVYPIEVWNINTNRLQHNFIQKGSYPELSMQEIARKEFVPFNVNGRINGLDINPSTGDIIITGTAYPIGTLEVNPKGELKQVFQNIYSTGYDARYSPDGKLAAFAYHGEHLMVYDVASNKLVTEYDLGGVPNGTRIIKFSKDSKYLAAGSDGNMLSIIDLTKKSIIENIEFPAGVFSLQWINNKKILVGTLLELYELDLDSKEKTTILESATTALDLYRNGKEVELIAVGRNEESIVLLDKNYKQLKTFSQNGVGRIAFSKDGKKIVATSEYETFIWNISNASKKTCEEFDEQIWAMAYDKDKQLIYTGGDGGKVHIWDNNCKEINP